MGPCNDHSGMAKSIQILEINQNETKNIIDKIHVKVLVILVGMCSTMTLLLINFILKHYTTIPTIVSALEAPK